MENLIQYWPEFFYTHIISIVKAMLLALVGIFLLKKTRSFFNKYLYTRAKDPTLGLFAINALSGIIIVILVIIVLEQLGVPTTSLVTLLGASGLAVGLALKGSLTNIAGGLMLLILRPFKVGDYVDAGNGAEGNVIQINLFNTLLKTSDNQVVYLPNLKLIDTVITNYNQQETRRIQVKVCVSYATKIKHVKEVLHELFRKNSKILDQPEPSVVVLEFTDYGILLDVQIWAKLHDYTLVKAIAYEEILEIFAENGITIATLNPGNTLKHLPQQA